MKLLKNITILSMLVLLTIFSTSCKKIKDSLNTSIDNTDQLFELLEYSPQSFQGQAGGYWTIIGEKGTRIRFNPQSFKDVSGNYISTGTIDIELIETPKATDMLLNKTVTMVGSDRLLESGGSINIKASQNGQKLQAGRYGIDFVQDASSTNDMGIFQGRTDSDQGLTSWLETPTNTQQGTILDSVDFYYQFDSVFSFQWINCDRFKSVVGPQTNATIKVTGTNSALPAIVFVIFPETNSVSYMNLSNGADLTNFDLGGYQIPVGINAYFVGLFRQGNENYFGSLKNQTITNNYNGTMNLEKMTADQIRSEIQNLY